MLRGTAIRITAPPPSFGKLVAFQPAYAAGLPTGVDAPTSAVEKPPAGVPVTSSRFPADAWTRQVEHDRDLHAREHTEAN